MCVSSFRVGEYIGRIADRRNSPPGCGSSDLREAFEDIKRSSLSLNVDSSTGPIPPKDDRRPCWSGVEPCHRYNNGL